MGRPNDQNSQLQRTAEQRAQAAPIMVNTVATTTTQAETFAGPVQVSPMAMTTTATATTTTTTAQAVQQLQQNRRRYAPVIARPAVVAAAPVQDPYAGMSRIKRHHAEKRERNRIASNQKHAKAAQLKLAKQLETSPEKIAPDALELLQRGQKFERAAQAPFDLAQASAMQLDLDCLEERDYVNERQTIGIETILQQSRTLNQIAQVRETQRDVWEALDQNTRAKCQALLDQREAYQACLENVLQLHNLKFDDKGKLKAGRSGDRAGAQGKAAQALEMLRIRKLMAEADAASYASTPQRQYTQAEKDSCAAWEREAYRRQFVNEPLLQDMSPEHLGDFVHGCYSTPPEYKQRVRGWTDALVNQHGKTWSAKDLKLSALDRDVMIAIGAQEWGAFEQATEAEKQQRFAEAERLMTSITRLCRLDKNQPVPNLTREQAVEDAYACFTECFSRFQTAFERERSRMQTAFTPEGRLLQTRQLSRFYGWWQALHEVYKQSPLLMARIPQEQLIYARSVGAFIYQSELTIQQMVTQEKQDVRQRRNRSFNDAEEAAQLTNAVRREMEQTVSADHLTQDHPLRNAVARYAAQTGLSRDAALHVLREMEYDDKFAEQFRTTGRRIDMTDLCLRDRFALLMREQKKWEQQMDARSRAVRDLLRQRHSEEACTAILGARLSVKTHVVKGLYIDRFIRSLPVMQPDISDEEIVRMFEANAAVSQYAQAESAVRNLEKDAAGAAVTALQRSHAQGHAPLKAVLTGEQMQQLRNYDQAMLDRLSAGESMTQTVDQFVTGLTEQQAAALQTYVTEQSAAMQRIVGQKQTDPVSLLSEAQRQNYERSRTYLVGLTDEQRQQIDSCDRFMRDKIANLLRTSLDTMQQKFGDQLWELHVMDLLELMGEDYFRYSAITQDLVQMAEGLRDTGVLPEEERARLGEQAHFWNTATRIRTMQKELDADPNVSDMEALNNYARRAKALTTTNPRDDGPRMTAEQKAAYIRHVRLRYPEMLYGQFA